MDIWREGEGKIATKRKKRERKANENIFKI